MKKLKNKKSKKPKYIVFGKPYLSKCWYYTKTSEINEGLK